MPGGERGDADDMNVVFDRLAGGLGGGREQRADIDVETEIATAELVRVLLRDPLR
jgi:hypothetical protein